LNHHIGRAILCCVLLALCLSVRVATARSAYELGFKGGMVISDFYGDQVKVIAGDVGPKFGFTAGTFIKIRLSKRFDLQPEFIFVMKGAKVDSSLTDTLTDEILYGTLNSNLNYIEFPVLLKYKMPGWKKIIPTVYVGPALAFSVSSQVVFTGDRRITFDIDYAVKDTDFGIVLGGDLTFPHGYGYLVIDARVTIGPGSLDARADRSIHNIAFMLSLGFHF